MAQVGKTLSVTAMSSKREQGNIPFCGQWYCPPIPKWWPSGTKSMKIELWLGLFPQEIEACKHSCRTLADDKECGHSGKYGGQLIFFSSTEFWKEIKRGKKNNMKLRNIPKSLHSMDNRQSTHLSSPTMY